ncbi:MAG: cytochrome c-type biogenesis protein [Betaproteobacteria bacterium]
MLAVPLLAIVFAQAQALTALDVRLKNLEEELRCLVCQNQTLADSTAPLAQDLRREVREQAELGKSDAEIKQYLVARYGDFVLYKPPVKPTTWLLWFGPFAFLLGGALIWFVVLRRRGRGGQSADEGPATPPSGGQAARARALLDGSPEK